MTVPRLDKGKAVWIAWSFAMACTLAKAESPRAEFFRGINLNGPSLVIDGRRWEGGDSEDLESADLAFENQAVALVPSTDPARAEMIRSSRWNNQADIKVTHVPKGTYSLF